MRVVHFFEYHSEADSLFSKSFKTRLAFREGRYDNHTGRKSIVWFQTDKERISGGGGKCNN